MRSLLRKKGTKLMAYPNVKTYQRAQQSEFMAHPERTLTYQIVKGTPTERRATSST